MRWHSEFTQWLYTQFPNTDKNLILKILIYTTPGVAPEACGGEQKAVLDLIAEADYKRFLPVTDPVLIPPPAPVKPKFKFGQISIARLGSLLPALRSVVNTAINLSTVDFMVLQTVRTIQEQQAAVASGHSRTMQSKHLRQPDGFAHAVDLGVWKDGKVDWTFEHYAAIALAMDKAATQLGHAEHIRWGCAWDRVLSDFGSDEPSYLAEAKAYATRHAGSDLLDAPHFEWVP
jgi:peptidoglycan L-alanyl-D-glutamate endopeptidase CwlK